MLLDCLISLWYPVFLTGKGCTSRTCTVMPETFPKHFCTNFGLSLKKNAIFGKLKDLSAKGYMSHTLVLENLPATKWSRCPWNT